MKKLAAAAAALALLAPAAAHAQPVTTYGGAGPDTYLNLQLGAFVPQSDDLDAFDPGIAFSGTFGALFTKNLGVEGTLGYYRAETPGTVRMGVVPFLVSLRLVAPLQVAEVSARAGGGIHYVSFSSDGSIPFSDHDTAFGFHVGAAVGFHLSPTMAFGVDLLRTFVTAQGGGGGDVDVGGLLATVQLGYKF